MASRRKTRKKAGRHSLFSFRMLLGIGVGVLVLCLVALVVINARFQVVTPSPRISYEAIAPAAIRGYAVVRPALGQDYLKTRVLSDVPLPDWALGMALPYEIALMMAPDFGSSTIETTLFVNDRRLAPTIVDAVKKLNIPSQVSYIDWASQTLEPKGRGYLTMDGAMRMLPEAQTLVRKQWGRQPLALPALTSPDEHLIDVVLDNRDGGGCAILLSLLAANGAPANRLTQRDVVDVLVSASWAHLYADLTDAEELAIRLEIGFRENTHVLLLEGFAHSFDLFIEYLRSESGDPLPGSSALDGFAFTADYTLTNPDLWRRWVR